MLEYPAPWEPPYSTWPEPAGLLLNGQDRCRLPSSCSSSPMHWFDDGMQVCLPHCLVHCWSPINDSTKAGVFLLSQRSRLLSRPKLGLTDPP